MGDGTDLGGIGLQKIRSCIEVMDQFLSQGHPVVCSYVKADRSSKLHGEGAKDLLRSVTRILGVKDTQRLNTHITLGELGIDSLMSVEVKQTLERDYDLTLSMQDIRQLTIARIREISEGGTDASNTSEGTAARNGTYGDEEPVIAHIPLSGVLVPDRTIVEMNEAVDYDMRVFFLHPIEGHIDALRELASMLPVRALGLQWTPDVPTDSIEDMAAAYIQKIMLLQPEGPYHICGYSFGATVAFEVALQLQASAALVGTVTLLDGAPKFFSLYTQDRRSRFGERKKDHETAVLCGFLAQYLDLGISELTGLSTTPAGRWILEEFGLAPTDNLDCNTQLPREIREKLVVLPLIRNVHPVHNAGRRTASASAILKQIHNDSFEVSFVDATAYLDGKAFAVSVVDTLGKVINCASARTTDPKVDEQGAIPLIMKDGRRCRAYSDSQAAVRTFQKGWVAR
ncbi:hypothetical protein HPB50_022696 [Hyalomma asiaticum]|uniref:Uncharacterized protein n=1 Tax=Hyalomma asiaticum TaxID=266040 RepID=A0ACB7TBK6_HYAAI|nr:hypothetical protein HPB50_022696 [Hyalomma asiaticum]